MSRSVLCHDCRVVMSDDDRLHYVYQCHDCVVVEHDRLRLVAADPDHPDAIHLGRSAVDLTSRTAPGRHRDAA